MPATEKQRSFDDPDVLERPWPEDIPQNGMEHSKWVARQGREAKKQFDDCINEASVIDRQLHDESLHFSDAQAKQMNERADRLLERAKNLKKFHEADWQRAENGATNSRFRNPLSFGTGESITNRDHSIRNDMKPEEMDNAGFNSLSDFLRSVARVKTTGAFDERLRPLMQAGDSGGQGSYSDPYGGFLVPESFRAEIITSADQDAPWLGRRMRFEVRDGQGDSVTSAVLEDRDRSDKDVAGVSLKRIAEATKFPYAKFKFSRQRLELHKAGTLVRVSSELLEDSAIGVDAMVREQFQRTVLMRQALDYIEGTGVGEPLGIINAPMTMTVDKEGGQAANTINGQNILKMRARATRYNRMEWLAHPSAFIQLSQARIVGDESDIWLFRPGNGADVPDTLLGRPIFWHESAMALGNAGDLILHDPSRYQYMQKAIRVDTSTHVEFESDEIVFRIALRDAGHPWSKQTLKDTRDYESSDFITLQTRD